MEVDKIKKEYEKKITDRITTYKDLILESFVEFYGEEYRNVITTRFNDISFLYYINDITIFYIVDSLKQGYSDKFKNIIFAIPYIVHLIKNNFYKQEITPDSFYELGINKIVGSSDEKLLLDKELLKYSIATALREKNECPYEVNLPINNGIKWIIALPIFSVDDKSLFHEINHAISSEIVTKNGEITVKCGLDYENEEKKYYNEILNDIISLEIYNIFKQKCEDNILEDNIMNEVLFDTYIDYHCLINEFYEKNKMRIKSFFIDFNAPQLEQQDLEYLSKLKKQQGIKR